MNRSARPHSETAPPEPGWIDLCPLAHVSEAVGFYIVCNGRALAVFRVGPAAVRVFDDVCPHAGASLSAGHLDDDCVVCPWHAWSFDMETGQCPDNPTIKIRVYRTRVWEGQVWVNFDNDADH